MDDKYAIGVDYGANSVRALIVDVSSGEAGILLDPSDPNLARQSPLDYVEGFSAAVAGAVEKARAARGFAPERIMGIGVDTTGSTPLPVDALAFHEEFQDELRLIRSPRPPCWSRGTPRSPGGGM